MQVILRPVSFVHFNPPGRAGLHGFEEERFMTRAIHAAIRLGTVALLSVCATAATSQDAINPEGLHDATGRPYSPYADRAFPTQVYFGDTHVHTALSADAGGSGTRLRPRDAYRFARGEQVTSNTGQPVKLAQPLDDSAPRRGVGSRERR
ncbi:DUF3604 domain-containing protein [Salipiger mangrovisoli]|uniref:DUF3604 domain-containing protein n=1 Tax=Salipiger mangrovisoli TaxID=2865933 RepID=UPI001F11F6A4|nr:DUF3604 domain-containing protein [Salipiger mangrovisoli]